MSRKKRKPREGYTDLNLRFIPTAVKKKFKVWCAENEISMNNKIVELMKETTK